MKRKYLVNTVREAKFIGSELLKKMALENVIFFGLPEVDDRYHIWRIPLKHGKKPIGEIVIDARTSLIDEQKTTTKRVLEARLLGRDLVKEEKTHKMGIPKISTLRNTIGIGDSEELLSDTPTESVDLVFTSPPYFNARPEYSDYIEYEEYLLKMKKIIRQCHRVLNEGRFFVINISPVLIRRSSRNESSRRIAVPFDLHQLFIQEKYEFIDDIIWQKPEGAGWATGRGRRFSADRNPLQYKPVPVTEYVLVYRKKSNRLIDWHIRKHPNQKVVDQSKIDDDYDVTNIWKISPAHSKKHPAIFPEELAAKVVKYYSFRNDVVLDPFGGIGTTAKAAYKNNRRFVIYEINPNYVDSMKDDLPNWFADEYKTINWINTKAKQDQQLSFIK